MPRGEQCLPTRLAYTFHHLTVGLHDTLYPPQLHFEQEIISSNRKKKNFTLVCITIIQVISVQLGFPQVLIFSFNGILVSILLIVAEKIKQKHGGFLYEAVE